MRFVVFAIEEEVSHLLACGEENRRDQESRHRGRTESGRHDRLSLHDLLVPIVVETALGGRGDTSISNREGNRQTHHRELDQSVFGRRKSAGEDRQGDHAHGGQGDAAKAVDQRLPGQLGSAARSDDQRRWTGASRSFSSTGRHSRPSSRWWAIACRSGTSRRAASRRMLGVRAFRSPGIGRKPSRQPRTIARAVVGLRVWSERRGRRPPTPLSTSRARRGQVPSGIDEPVPGRQ